MCYMCLEPSGELYAGSKINIYNLQYHMNIHTVHAVDSEIFCLALYTYNEFDLELHTRSLTHKMTGCRRKSLRLDQLEKELDMCLEYERPYMFRSKTIVYTVHKILF